MRIFKKKQPDWNNIIVKAAEAGDVDLVEKALQNGANVNAVNKDGRNALMRASSNGHLRVLKVLVAALAEIEARAPGNNGTAVQFCAANGHTECAAFLIKSGGRIDSQNIWGQTPLHLTLKNNHMDTCLALIKMGANLNIKNDKKKSPADILKAVNPELLEAVSRQVNDNTMKENNTSTFNEKAPPQNSDSQEVFERIGDDTLMKATKNSSGIELTTIFNFQIGDITCIQIKNGVKLSENIMKFSELDDLQSIKPMYDKLIELGGTPPIEMFREKRALHPKHKGSGR